MKKLIYLLIALSVLSCQNTKDSLTKDEFESIINNAEKSNITKKQLTDGWYETSHKENEFLRVDKKTPIEYFINPKPIVLPENFKKFEEFENYQGFKGLGINFDKQGADAWSIATKENVGLHLIFIMDNEILTAQIVNSQIFNGASAFWEEDLNEEQWNRIKNTIKN